MNFTVIEDRKVGLLNNLNSLGITTLVLKIYLFC